MCLSSYKTFRVFGERYLLKHTPPVHFFVDQANIDNLRMNEKNPSSVGYPSGRFTKLYDVVGQEVYGKAALANPSLHNTLKSGARQPRVLRELPDFAGWRG